MKIKKVLVTGAAGFIGSHVVDACLSAGMEVVAIDDLSGGFIENVPAGATFIKGDIKDVAFISSLARFGRFDCLYHLAAYAAEGLSHFIRNYNYATNLIGSVNLLNFAVNQNIPIFVFTSSIAVYGKNQVPMEESMQPLPEDPYGISKYAFELDLRAAHEMYGMNYIVFRPHNVYGERQNIADKYRNVIGIFMNNALKNEPMPIFGDGEQTRAFSYIADVAPVIAKAPLYEKGYNEIYNIGADVPYTVNTLAKEVSDAMGVPLNIKYLPARNEVQHAFSSHAKVKLAYSLKEPVSLSEGIRQMTHWVKSKGSATPIVFKNIEITKNLPISWRG